MYIYIGYKFLKNLKNLINQNSLLSQLVGPTEALLRMASMQMRTLKNLQNLKFT